MRAANGAWASSPSPRRDHKIRREIDYSILSFVVLKPLINKNQHGRVTAPMLFCIYEPIIQLAHLWFEPEWVRELVQVQQQQELVQAQQ